MAGMSNREVEPPPLMPGWLTLSDHCLDKVERAWSKIGAHLTPLDRQWVGFIVQLEAECAKFQKERRPSTKAPWLAGERNQRNKRHRDIAKAADGLAALIAAEFADGSQAAPSLQEKLRNVSLTLLADAVARIAAAARSNGTVMTKLNGAPRSVASREDLIVNLARICRDAGGKPSRRNAFWEGIEAINEGLPELARMSVAGLKERSRKAGWLTKNREGSKSSAGHASIF